MYILGQVQDVSGAFPPIPEKIRSPPIGRRGLWLKHQGTLQKKRYLYKKEYKYIYLRDGNEHEMEKRKTIQPSEDYQIMSYFEKKIDEEYKSPLI